jgi:hypothetical protein
LQQLLEAVHLERLFQRRPVAIAFGQAALAITRGKDERPATGHKRVRHRRDRLTLEIDVEDRDIELRGFRRLQRLVDASRLGGDRVAELAQHVLEQHADHQLVFDDEDPLGRQPGLGLRGHLVPGFSIGTQQAGEQTVKAKLRHLSRRLVGHRAAAFGP